MNNEIMVMSGSLTREDKIKLYNKVSNTDGRISSLVNKDVKVVNVIFTDGEIKDNETGEYIPVERAIIFTADGKAYHATSLGIVSSLHSVIAMFGEPSTWEEPITICPVEKVTKSGHTFVLELK
jgi:hypothetical protein